MRNTGTQGGYSLLEVMVSLAISVVVLLGMYEFTIDSQRIHASQQELMAMDQGARVAIETLVRSVRTAGSDPMETAFDPNVTDSVLFPIAQANAIRILADLPQDHNGDGDQFDINNDGDDIWENNENENGDGMLLPANADREEDVTFFLSPSTSSYVPTGSGPWTLIQRVSNGSGGFTNIPLASNIINEAGQPGLQFRYILKMVSGNSNFDTLPLPFSTRWAGLSGTGVALNSASYTTVLDKKMISRVLIRFSVRSSNPDRKTGSYRFISFEEDIDVRVQS